MTKIAALIIALFIIVSPLALAFAEAIRPRSIGWYHQHLEERHFPASLSEAFKVFKKGDYQKALVRIQAKRKSMKRTVSPEKIFLLEGVCRQASGKHKEAIEDFRQSLRNRGSDSDTLLLIAQSQLSSNDYNAALSSLQDSLWFGRSTIFAQSEIQLSLAYTYMMLNTPAKASQSLAAVIQLDPANAPAKSLLASLALDGGNRADAVRLTREALTLSPEDPALKLQLAQALLKNVSRDLNRAEVAEAASITAALMQEKKLPASIQQPLTLTRAQALLATGNPATARKLVAGALKRQPSDQSLLALQEQIALEEKAKASLSPNGKQKP